MSEIFEFVDHCAAEYAYPIAKMCHWLEVSRSGFYEWRGRPESATAARRGELTAHVRRIFTESDQTYGYRRVHRQLGREDITAGPELVRDIMRVEGLVACQPRPWRHLTGPRRRRGAACRPGRA